MDLVSLLNWNPAINVLCTNLGDLADMFVCVSPPGGLEQGTTITSAPPTSTTGVSTAVPKPPNGKEESNYPCASWYTIQAGDYCEAVSIRQGIALRDFLFLNPSINAACNNLLLDIAYCVAAVGDINTYPSYPYSTTQPYTLSPPAYITTTETFSTVAPILTPIPVLPLAPGSRNDCANYAGYIPIPVPDFQHEQPIAPPPISKNINSCEFRLSGQGTLQDFLAWNPSLATIEPCYLQPGYRYCTLNHTSYTLGMFWSALPAAR